MGNRPENTLGTNAPLESNPLRAIDLVCNESFAADRRWFFTDQEMREYLCGQRSAYANDTGVVRDADGVIGTWYIVQMYAWTAIEDEVEFDDHYGEETIAEYDARRTQEEREVTVEVKLADLPLGQLSDKWRDAVGIETPTGPCLGEVIDNALKVLARDRLVAKARQQFINSYDDGGPYNEPKVKDYVDFGEDLSHAEKVAAGMPTGGSDDCPDCGDPFCMGCNFNVQREDDEAAKFLKDIYDHEALERKCGVLLKAPDHIQLTIDARRAAKLEGNCEDGYPDPDDDGGDDPMDMGDFGAGTRGNPNWEQRKPVELTDDELDGCPF